MRLIVIALFALWLLFEIVSACKCCCGCYKPCGCGCGKCTGCNACSGPQYGGYVGAVNHHIVSGAISHVYRDCDQQAPSVVGVPVIGLLGARGGCGCRGPCTCGGSASGSWN